MKRMPGAGAVLAAVLVAGGAVAPVGAQETDVSAAPTFTPFTKKPELRNRAAVAGVMREVYPPLLRQAGIGGKAICWLFIDRTGATRKVQLFRSTGYENLDEAAARVARAMEFTPAENRGVAVDVWVQLPIDFVADPEVARPQEERSLPGPPRGHGARSRAEVSAKPAFTPYTEKPRLANAPEIASALVSAYPRLLRDAGIGGTATVWFLIDEEGQVVKRQLARTSGHAALDEAALAVAAAMRFEPARNRGEPVLVWVQIPVTFAAK